MNDTYTVFSLRFTVYGLWFVVYENVLIFLGGGSLDRALILILTYSRHPTLYECYVSGIYGYDKRK